MRKPPGTVDAAACPIGHDRAPDRAADGAADGGSEERRPVCAERCPPVSPKARPDAPAKRPSTSSSDPRLPVSPDRRPAGSSGAGARAVPIDAPDTLSARPARGRRAEAAGRLAETIAADALAADGWRILGRRLRTPAGEIDLAVERAGLLAFVEVKTRPTLAVAATSVTPRQRQRLAGAAALLLARHPEWGAAGVRFDVVVVDAARRVRRIADAFRVE